MESKTSITSIVKRVNLAILTFALIYSAFAGHLQGLNEHLVDLRNANARADEIALQTRPFDPDKFLAETTPSTNNWKSRSKLVPNSGALFVPPTKEELAAAKVAEVREMQRRDSILEEQLKEVSLVGPIISGTITMLYLFCGACFAMMFLSWVLGYGFKLHVSTK